MRDLTILPPQTYTESDEARDAAAYAQSRLEQETVFSLADKLVDAELAKGRGLTEGLTDWAIHEAKRQLGI